MQFISFTLATVLLAVVFAAIDVHVDCSASPPSTVLTTMTAARDHVRTFQPLNASVIVHVAGDCHGAAAVLQLDGALDSGTAAFTITYSGSAAASGGTPARLLGGPQLPANLFRSSPLSPHIWTLNLSLVNFTAATDLGHIAGVSPLNYEGRCNQDRAEIFMDGVPMLLARYPNVQVGGGPWMDWMFVETPTSRDRNKTFHGHPWQGDTFTVNSTRVARWAAALALPDSSVWLHGFWEEDFFASYIRLANATAFDGDASEAALSYDPATPPVYLILREARFYILNLLEELDSPGEYFVDVTTNTLYFYPPRPLTNASDVALSMLRTPIISLEPHTVLQHVVFQDLTVMYGVVEGISLVQTDHVVLRNVVSSNNGRHNVVMTNAMNTLIEGLASHGAGCCGVVLTGGDTATLTPSNTTLRNSQISTYARWARTYNPGISYKGVGLALVNNAITNAPHQGMYGDGNDHLIMNNTFKDLCYGVRDSAAVYIYLSYIHRGTLVRGNVFRNIQIVEPTRHGSAEVYGVYIDGQQSGVTIDNNTVVNGSWGIFTNGGRDNIVTNNRCVQLTGWCLRIFAMPVLAFPRMKAQLAAVRDNRAYAVAYPRLLTTMQFYPHVAAGNVYMFNTWCKVPHQPMGPAGPKKIESWHSIYANNTKYVGC
jgi:parallel beta-helix repeat protein